MFLGRGTILRFKKPSSADYGFEIDKTICDKWESAILPESFIILNGNAFDLLNNVKNHVKDDLPWWQETFIYCDPPYLLETRSCNKKGYKYEFTRADHINLLNLLKSLKCNIAISCYDNELYSTMLQDWRKIHFKAQTKRKTVIETLYMNYPEPSELHDYRFIGSNYRERDRIQQKIKRHISRLQKLPVHERNAIINAIISKI